MNTWHSHTQLYLYLHVCLSRLASDFFGPLSFVTGQMIGLWELVVWEPLLHILCFVGVVTCGISIPHVTKKPIIYVIQMWTFVMRVWKKRVTIGNVQFTCKTLPYFHMWSHVLFSTCVKKKKANTWLNVVHMWKLLILIWENVRSTFDIFLFAQCKNGSSHLKMWNVIGNCDFQIWHFCNGAYEKKKNMWIKLSSQNSALEAAPGFRPGCSVSETSSTNTYIWQVLPFRILKYQGNVMRKDI